MPTDTDPRIDKLPMWARNIISTQKQNIEYYRNMVKTVEAHDTDTRIQDYEDGDRHLPEGTTVVFTGDAGEVSVQVTKYGSTGGLRRAVEISTAGLGAGSRLQIRPVASNVVEALTYD